MTPHQGSGAGQGIEDAYVLAALLAHPRTTRETLPVALKAYEAIRLPFAIDVQRRSSRSGRLLQLIEAPAEGPFAQYDVKTNDEEMSRHDIQANQNGVERLSYNGNGHSVEHVVPLEQHMNAGRVKINAAARLRGGDGETAEYRAFREIAECCEDNWKWAWTSDPRYDAEDAMRLFESRLG